MAQGFTRTIKTTVTGTADRIAVGGTVTDPIVDIAATYAGQTSITTLGTVATGTWAATDVGVEHGGTARSSATEYAVICGGTTATGAHQSVASVGSAGEVLTSNGAAALPTFQAAGGGGGGAWTFLAESTVSAVAAVDFNSTYITTTYTHYALVYTLTPANDISYLRVQASADNGSTILNTLYQTTATNITGTNACTILSINFGMVLNRDMGNATNEAAAGEAHFLNLAQTSSVNYYGCGYNRRGTGQVTPVSCGGIYTPTTALNFIRISMNSGNIATGTFTLYGIKTS